MTLAHDGCVSVCFILWRTLGNNRQLSFADYQILSPRNQIYHNIAAERLRASPNTCSLEDVIAATSDIMYAIDTIRRLGLWESQYTLYFHTPGLQEDPRAGSYITQRSSTVVQKRSAASIPSTLPRKPSFNFLI